MFFLSLFMQINSLIADTFKKFTENRDWENKITQAVESAQNAINNFSTNTENHLRDFTSQNFPELSSKLSPIQTTLNDWKIAASDKLEQLLSNREGIINDLADKTSNFLDTNLAPAQDIFSQWKTNIENVFNPILANPQQTFEDLVTKTTNYLEPKLSQGKELINNISTNLEQFWQSASKSIVDNFGNPENWNGERIGRVVENVFFSITKSIFFVVEESIKGIWHGVLGSVHDIWGILTLLVLGLFIFIIVRWQLVR